MIVYLGNPQTVSFVSAAAGISLGVILLAAPGRAAGADDETSDTIRMEEHQVVGERATEAAPFLQDVQGTSIYAGKKTTVIDPQVPAKIVNDNYRQALARVPGLYLSEETTPLVSIGYRGLEPHRTQFTMVLKDGVPIAADLFGYPENYYMPPLDSIDEIHFVHGGASLLYGPQIGGALNYITRKPNPNQRISLYSNQTWGNDQYYSTYNELSGTRDRFGYQGYYYQKQGNGFRDSNSDFDLYSGSLKLTYELNDTNRLLVAFDGYNEEHGEPGGLAAQPGEGHILYSTDRNATTRMFDRFNLERYIGWGIWESDLTPDTLLRVSGWGGHYTRLSRRQNGGGFGTLPSGDAADTNAIENQQFNTFGLDARVRQNWSAFDETHTLTAGATYYHGDSPRTDKRGSTPDATEGAIRNKSERLSDYGSLFAENRFAFGKFALIPAVRLENFSESINEKINVSKTAAGVPLSDESTYEFVPLFGVGAVYTFWPTVDAYANVSRSYRPQVFTQAVPTSPTQIVAGDLDPTSSYQYEIGFRGNPWSWAYWDTSLFWLEIDDQIGTVQLVNDPQMRSEIRNVGAARHLGWELAAEVGTLSLFDHFSGNTLATRLGDLSLYGNVMLLDAEFTDGPNEGKTPQYAPDYLVRAGVQYVYPRIAKVSLLSTAVANSYANDNNSADFFIPHYNVWDLTMEANVYRELVALHFGVNNLFNENYFARVRSDGIDPAYRRNFYGGVKVNL